MVGRPVGAEALSYGMAEAMSTPAHDDLIPKEGNTRVLKKRRLWSVGIGALVLMTMVLAACESGGTTTTHYACRSGSCGTVIDGLYEEPDTLLPYLTNETYAIIVDQALWAPLWYGDNQGVLHSGIADLPTPQNGYIAQDLKTLTVHLHSGLKWSDGSPITADDVAFSFNLYGNPDFANTFGFPTTAAD